METIPPPDFQTLEDTALEVIRRLKAMPEFGDARIAVIGGMAIWKLMPTFRTTEDVDFIITAAGAPASVKKKLLSLPDSPFGDFAGVFMYKHPPDIWVQIDMTPSEQSPYVPSAAVRMNDIQDGTLPYIDVIDLIAFKINSCGLRSTPQKRTRDAGDAAFLVEYMAERGTMNLNQEQKDAVLNGLADVVGVSGRPKEWWTEKLGL